MTRLDAGEQLRHLIAYREFRDREAELALFRATSRVAAKRCRDWAASQSDIDLRSPIVLEFIQDTLNMTFPIARDRYDSTKGASFSTFYAVIAQRAFIDTWRRYRTYRRRHVLSESAIVGALHEPIDDADMIDRMQHQWPEEEIERRAGQLASRLFTGREQVIVDMTKSGMTKRDVGRHIGIHEGNVGRALSKAEAKVIKFLEEEPRTKGLGGGEDD